MATPESRVKKRVKEVLDRMGAYYFAPVQMGMGARTLDYLVCYKGKFFGIEAKGGEDKKPTKLQELCMKKIREAGGECVVIRTVVEADQLEHWLEQHAGPDYSEEQVYRMRTSPLL